MADIIKVCKVNIDDNQVIASSLGIMSIPTLVIFKNGKELGRIVGALSEGDLINKIKHFLGE